MRILVIVTGEPRSGKTSVLRRALGILADRGVGFRACLSEATERVPEGLALGFDLVSYDKAPGTPRMPQEGLRIRECAREELARRPPPRPGKEPLRERMAPFSFSASAFARAAAFLAAAPLDRTALILDEIGPLELESGGGFLPALERAAADPAPRALALSVRPALAAQLAARLGTPETRTIWLDGTNEEAAGELAAELLSSAR